MKVQKRIFLPHQPVIKVDRDTTKCRVVFDASAKDKDKQFCLNDYLEEGPNTIPNVFDVLINFRSKPVGLTADIHSAFLQIGIDPIDREKMRFLWYENVKSCEQPKLVQYRFARLMFGLKPSPPILGKIVQHHLSFYEDAEPEVVNELKKLYVDDLATSSETDHKAYQTYKTAKQIMSEGRFNLRKWRTNSKTLLKRINEAEKLPFDDTQLDKDLRENVKVLGLCWNTNSDEFTFDFKGLIKFANSMTLTKRNVLRFVGRFYDPLGFLSPFTVRVKTLFQELCVEKTHWDSSLTEAHNAKFFKILSETENLNQIRVMRALASSKANAVRQEIHGFSDASEKAFSAVAYLKTMYDDAEPDVRLIAAKTKVAPLIKQTVPRLELMGAGLLARLVKSVQSHLPFPTTNWFWSDSMTTLAWIRNYRP